MNATAPDRPQFTNLAHLGQIQIDRWPRLSGMHYWQRALLAVAVLQLKLPARAFATSVVVHWNDQTLRSTLDTHLAPQSIARIIAIVQTCGYDAWSAYDSVAIGTQLGASLRRPPEERTEKNKAQAFSYGAYRALLDLAPQLEQQRNIRRFMARLGYDPDDESTDTTTPTGIGNVAAAAVLASDIRTAPVVWEI